MSLRIHCFLQVLRIPGIPKIPTDSQDFCRFLGYLQIHMISYDFDTILLGFYEDLSRIIKLPRTSWDFLGPPRTS